MKKPPLKAALFGIAVCWVLIYLMGAFVAVSFDIAKWDLMGRLFAACVAVVIAAATLTAWHEQP